ncbi:replication protein A 32 kDa subunit A-like [Rutidosis leptorrhynchoides]|uniref:replication protein A 32 kDa subunit A-like n=1 Tax=Rutidosis leptorrhynchoides TaxID=125765 RepID=UPI003A999DA9
MMFSESQFDGSSQIASSPATAGNRDTFGLVPLTVKQISEALHSGDDKSNFSISGADVVNVTVVGMVSNIVERNSYVTFTIDDGTGNLECKRWLNQPFDKMQIEAISEGIYVHVDGHLKSFKGERHVDVFSVRPVTNFDEITFHFIACIHNHLRTTKDQKTQGNGTNFTGNQSSTPNTPIQNGTNGSKSTLSSQSSVPFNVDGLKGFDQMVLAYLQFPANYEKEKGIHTDELAQKLKLPHNKIMETIRTLEEEGMIYSTIDESHYKATCSS